MLNARLSMVMSLIDPCVTLCDIGSDHAYLPLEGLKSGLIKKAQIVEINPKPLIIARANMQKEQLDNVCSFFLSDGIKAVHEPVENTVICGVGFDTMVHIIEQDLDRFKAMKQFILQSNTKVPLLRKQMETWGFELVDEGFSVDRHRAYIALKYRYSALKKSLNPVDLYCGPHLMRQDSHEYRVYCQSRLNHCESTKRLQIKYEDEIKALRAYLNAKETV